MVQKLSSPIMRQPLFPLLSHLSRSRYASSNAVKARWTKLQVQLRSADDSPTSGWLGTRSALCQAKASLASPAHTQLRICYSTLFDLKIAIVTLDQRHYPRPTPPKCLPTDSPTAGASRTFSPVNFESRIALHSIQQHQNRLSTHSKCYTNRGNGRMIR